VLDKSKPLQNRHEKNEQFRSVQYGQGPP
jgi:hypothetical protein